MCINLHYWRVVTKRLPIKFSLLFASAPNNPFKIFIIQKKIVFQRRNTFLCFKGETLPKCWCINHKQTLRLACIKTYQCDEFHRGIICCRWSLSDIHQVTFYQRKILANALSLLMRNDDVCIGFHILKEKWQVLFVSWCHSYHTVGPFFPLSEFRLIGLNYNLWVNLLTRTCG